jgi:hypothetical protein
MENAQNTAPVIYPKKKIAKAAIVALIVSGLISIFAILPAEYGIDVTGAGRLLGLTGLSTGGGISLTESFVSSPWPYEETSEEITVEPGKGLEYKLAVNKGSVMVFSWSASQPIYYDFHGEPTDEKGKQFLPFKSHEIDTAGQSAGFLVPEFTGTHGWYWRNDGTAPITVSLKATGFYEVVGVKKPTP